MQLAGVGPKVAFPYYHHRSLKFFTQPQPHPSREGLKACSQKAHLRLLTAFSWCPSTSQALSRWTHICWTLPKGLPFKSSKYCWTLYTFCHQVSCILTTWASSQISSASCHPENYHCKNTQRGWRTFPQSPRSLGRWPARIFQKRKLTTFSFNRMGSLCPILCRSETSSAAQRGEFPTSKFKSRQGRDYFWPAASTGQS